MSVKTASFSTISSVSQSLLKSIESENQLPVGLFRNLQTLSQSQTLVQDELQGSIFETADLLKQRLLETIAAAHRHRNSHLPIQRLPSEILSTTIAHALAEIESYNYQQRLIQLSTVSRWWRSVALGTSPLWATINSKDEEWIISLALVRSQNAPLSVVWEEDPYCRRLKGGDVYRYSMGAGDFFKLVSPHMARWGGVTLPQLEHGLNQHKIQLSRHLRQLSLSGNGSPSTEAPITGFFGPAERLLDIKLQNLHISPADIIHILSTSGRIVSLTLESLVALDEDRQESQALPENEVHNNSPATIDLSCLNNLSLRWLPSSVLLPIVQGINVSSLETVSIAHQIAAEDPAETNDPVASFIAKLIARTHRVTIDLRLANVTLQPPSDTTCQYTIELQGEYSVILPWLRLHLIPQITEEYSIELKIGSGGLGDTPSEVVLNNVMRFPEVESVVLEGSRESWRWVWLLSLPDAVQTGSWNSGRKHTKSWLWPGLRHLTFHGDYVSEFTILSVLLARYGPPSKGRSTVGKDALLRRLVRLEVHPGGYVWRAEVLDRIREVVAPGRFYWIES